VGCAGSPNYFGTKEGLMKDTIINLLESSWKLREELWDSELPFPKLLKRTVTIKNVFSALTVSYLAALSLCIVIASTPPVQGL
jgi:hypothetical protein